MAMYPYSVFELSPDATDEQVHTRYRELVAEHPPDRAPELFAMIRQAYGSLSTKHARARTLVFHFDETGRSITEEMPRWLRSRPRRRLMPGELVHVLDPE